MTNGNLSIADTYGTAELELWHRVTPARRYRAVAKKKVNGATYTPRTLADFVAEQIMSTANSLPRGRAVRVLDPAVGDGELVLALLRALPEHASRAAEVHAFDTDHDALVRASERICNEYPDITLHMQHHDFVEFVLGRTTPCDSRSDPNHRKVDAFDLIISNPPYVRTQILGGHYAQFLANRFGLSGRVDLYHAFVLGISEVLATSGTAGIITSNRFMTTKSGADLRQAVLERFEVRQIWDLGDTKPFDASVLPAVLVLGAPVPDTVMATKYSSIYETESPATAKATDPIAALRHSGVVEVSDGRRFSVRHGNLSLGASAKCVWRLTTRSDERWLSTIRARTGSTFREVGKIRVGVKTCADPVFVRADWHEMPDADRPELLRPLLTHHVAHRFRAATSLHPRQILYPHEVVGGCRRAVDINRYPKSRRYLESHRTTLQGRQYVSAAGRNWYEIWVPQDPDAWASPKLVFRDIAEKPTFWVDLDGSVVNGDCYWLACNRPEEMDMLWLAAAVGNSTFVERFYDVCFNNKLYSGRRRFMTQYVEQFPLPDPSDRLSQEIISLAKQAYECSDESEFDTLYADIDRVVWMSLTGKTPEPS